MKEDEQRLDSVGRYLKHVRGTPGIQTLLESANMVSQCKSASDWSYTATAYASPGVRLVGDAASFIDPFFSSGVHIALAGGLSAATTICASIRGHCTEAEAGLWHSAKISETYARFLLVVSMALTQIRAKKEVIILDEDEQTFERAFEHFRPSMSISLLVCTLS
jgi:flavin-dependent dehydrogenase